MLSKQEVRTLFHLSLVKKIQADTRPARKRWCKHRDRMAAHQENMARNMRGSPGQKKCSPQRVDLCWYHEETGCEEGKESSNEQKPEKSSKKKKAQEDYTATDKKLRKASEKINETTMTTWPNKLKKLQDKETWENCIWSPRSCLTSSSRQTSQWRTKTAPLSHQQLEELKRWVEHFREQLNRPNTKNTSRHTTSRYIQPDRLQHAI